jgi:hypothetical protein
MLDTTKGMPTFHGIVKHDLSAPPGADSAVATLLHGERSYSGEPLFVPRQVRPGSPTAAVTAAYECAHARLPDPLAPFTAAAGTRTRRAAPRRTTASCCALCTTRRAT